MKPLVLFAFVALIGLVAAGSRGADSDWTVFLHRVGPLPVGASISEVRDIIGDQTAHLVQALQQNQTLPREPDDSPCAYLVSTKVPEQIGLMFQRGRLARIDVWKPGIRTASGVQVGDTEARVIELYGRQISVTAHHYPPVGAHYLIFTPVDESDREYRMLFETDGVTVTRFRMGLRAAVSQVEGCS